MILLEEGGFGNMQNKLLVLTLILVSFGYLKPVESNSSALNSISSNGSDCKYDRVEKIPPAGPRATSFYNCTFWRILCEGIDLGLHVDREEHLRNIARAVGREAR
jgi:hypothetical protein